ncbi:hypothetical protein DBR06_SOUSAS12410028, partial [Sousa chinensis]
IVLIHRKGRTPCPQGAHSLGIHLRIRLVAAACELSFRLLPRPWRTKGRVKALSGPAKAGALTEVLIRRAGRRLIVVKAGELVSVAPFLAFGCVAEWKLTEHGILLVALAADVSEGRSALIHSFLRSHAESPVSRGKLMTGKQFASSNENLFAIFGYRTASLGTRGSGGGSRLFSVAQILDMQRRQELWLLSREALDCGAGCRDPGTKAKHLLCASGSVASLHGPQNLSHLPLHEMFSVVGYFVGNNEGAELCDQFRYQLKPKHEQIRKSKESEDARSTALKKLLSNHTIGGKNSRISSDSGPLSGFSTWDLQTHPQAC